MDTYPLGLFEVTEGGDGPWGTVSASNPLARECISPTEHDWTAHFDTSSKATLAQHRNEFFASHIAIQVTSNNTPYLFVSNRGHDRVYCVLLKVGLVSHLMGTRRLLQVHSAAPSSAAPPSQMLRVGISLHLLTRAQQALQRLMRAAETEVSSMANLTVDDIDHVSKMELAPLQRGKSSSSIGELIGGHTTLTASSSTQAIRVSLDAFLFDATVRCALEYLQNTAGGSVSCFDDETEGEIQVSMDGVVAHVTADEAFASAPQLSVELALRADKTLVLCRVFVEAMQGRLFFTFDGESSTQLTLAIPYSRSADRNPPPLERPPAPTRSVTVPVHHMRLNGKQQQDGAKRTSMHDQLTDARSTTPVSIASMISEPAVPVPAGESAGTPKSPAPMHVLIVEDNQLNFKVLFKTIKFVRPAVTVEYASDGMLAIEKANSSHYDCIFMDIDIPIRNGFEAADAIRKHEGEHGLPPTYIVGVSGTVNADQERRMKVSGINTFITKPCTHKKVEAALNLVTM